MTYYVNMIDRFMSGWGVARGRRAIYSIRCDTFEQACAIEQAARKRPEMKYVAIAERPRPTRGIDQRTIRNFADVGGPWLEFWRPAAQ